MSKAKHRIVLLIGPSGSGKTTIANYLHDTYGWNAVSSYTTRPPRYDGEEGHIFVTDEEFDKLTNIIAYTEFDGHRYCATADQIDQRDLYIVDVDGVVSMQELYHGESELLPVYLDVSVTTCLERMSHRGDALWQITNRTKNDTEAFRDAKRIVNSLFDSVLVIGESNTVAEASEMIYRWATI